MILTLYSRIGCHLCEQMLQQLELLRQKHNFTINVIDIDSDPQLQREYAARVPVLAKDDQILCEYFLQIEHVEQIFTAGKP